MWLAGLLCAILITPTLPAGADQKLPLCCRTKGKHRCAMPAGSDHAGGLGIRSSRCDQFGADQISPSRVVAATPQSSRAIHSLVSDDAAPPVQPQTLRQLLSDDTGRKRGPPSLS